MALVESHPLAFQMEEFAWNLRDHIVGLNLGRWDYMASLIHFNLNDPDWVFPDRNTIPHDVPFFQNLRELRMQLHAQEFHHRQTCQQVDRDFAFRLGAVQRGHVQVGQDGFEVRRFGLGPRFQGRAQFV